MPWRAPLAPQRHAQRVHAGAAPLSVVDDGRAAVQVGCGRAGVLLGRMLVLEQDERACAFRSIEHVEKRLPRGQALERATKGAALGNERCGLPVLREELGRRHAKQALQSARGCGGSPRPLHWAGGFVGHRARGAPARFISMYV